MTHILCIETSTTSCSVAICNEEGVLSAKEENEGYTHAENLHVFIEEVIKKSGLTKKELAAIAVGKGPGSYTGLRIGVSAAKGLCYALGIPLISVNTLYTIAVAAKENPETKDAVLCPMLDARRMEVYTARYTAKDLKELLPTHALVVSEQSLQQFDQKVPYVFFGDGMTKCRNLLQTLAHASFIENMYPSAIHMRKTVLQAFEEKRFEDVAYFEPFYLKEFFTGAK